ncbi:MAG TPA: class C sortase [Tissierellia bacterium]|nr:class C sortase [Tissierellia bacterium]
MTRRLGLLIIIIGFGFLLYPLTSITLNHLRAPGRMETFLAEQQSLTQENVEVILEQAHAYNQTLDGTANGAIDPFEVEQVSLTPPIDLEEGEVFAYLSIPKIDEKLPIFLGASEYHLDLGTAHIDGTNLPIGGKDTRSVIAGHWGWRTQTIFRNIPELVAGDQIFVHALGETLEYRVVDQEIIHPYEYGKLAVVPDEDTLTLLTCTYVNGASDRLLVNAKRVLPEEVIVTAEEQTAEAADLTEATGLHQTPETKVMVKRYGLMSVTLILWLILFVVVIRFLRTFRR